MLVLFTFIFYSTLFYILFTLQLLSRKSVFVVIVSMIPPASVRSVKYEVDLAEPLHLNV
jgi:hypothetical protein